MPRAAVVIVQDGAVALIRRVRGYEVFHLFPGGETEPGETVEQVAARGAREALGVEVRLGRPLAIVSYRGHDQFYFSAEIAGGEFGGGDGAAPASPAPSGDGGHTPVWLPLAQLDRHDVRPRAVADLLENGRLGAGAEPLRVVERERRRAGPSGGR